MTILVTGGAGFIGRWVVKNLLEKKENVVVIDNLINGKMENLKEFKGDKNLREIVIEDIRNEGVLLQLFEKYRFKTCIHLAAQINVQESLDNPAKAFEINVLGTYNVLESCRKYRTKIILIGTCMVYDLANSDQAISEKHEIKPSSPYAGTKIAAEDLAMSYYYSYDLPVVILRPFNTYGPFQKTNMEGGVVSIFVKNYLENKQIKIYGDGTQTRDFLYVEDCAEFIVEASKCNKCIGEVINAGTGKDISINNLAKPVVKNNDGVIQHVEHHHPQSEIMKLVCNNSKAKEILDWKPKTSLKEGIKKLENWIKQNKVNH